MSQPTTACISCGAELQGKFCSACGEKKISSGDFTLKHLLEQGVDVFTHVDSKLYKSLRALLFRPGKLTMEYIRGVRKPYMKPFQVFFLCNLVFFFFLGTYDIFQIPARGFFTGSNFGIDIREQVEAITKRKSIDIATLGQLYDAKVVSISKLFIILLVPIIALFSWPFGGPQHKEYGKHVIASLYFLSFLMLAMVVYAKILDWIPVQVAPLWFNLPFFTGMLIYTRFAFSRFPGKTAFISWIGSLTVVLGFLFSTFLYRWVISWLTLHSI